ncbi:hypothetical protein [Cohnella sp. 56]|uniref:hypothetical protein n=1 Tax=Cohnella sp. 56 TaxID=3113722 RepID=UPI0030E86769
MRLIQQQAPSVQELPGVTEPIPIREWRGVNTFDPLSIDDAYLTDAVNMTTADYPALAVRPGYTVLGGAIGGKVLGLGVWKDTELHAVFADGTWRKWTGSAWSTLKSGLHTTTDWTFTNFQGGWADINLVGVNGVDGMFRYDGSTVQLFGNAPAGSSYVTTYQNRLWVAFGQEIRASKLDEPEIFDAFGGTDSDSYGKTIETARGEDVIGLSAGLSRLTIATPNSLLRLNGSLPSDFQTFPITEDVGFASNKSAVTRDGELSFIHQLGIYVYTGGMLPDRAFSEIVKGYQTGISQSAAGTDGDRLYYTLRPDVTLVYDPRSGIEAWSVYKGFTPTCYARMQGRLYAGDAAGRVLRLEDGADDAGQPISWRAVSKAFTSAAIARRARWLKLWVVAEMAAGATMHVYLSKSAAGDADWELMQSVTGTGAMEAQRVIIPVGKYALERIVRVKLEGTGWVRIHELARQVRKLSL